MNKAMAIITFGMGIIIFTFSVLSLMYFIVVPATPEAGAKTFLSLLATAGACCIITTGAWAFDNYRDKK